MNNIKVYSLQILFNRVSVCKLLTRGRKQLNIVVVIPVYNPPQSLEKLLLDLSNIKFIKNILVIDDGSEKKIY